MAYSGPEFEEALPSKQLPWQLQFFLWREVPVKFLRRGLVHIIPLRRVVDTGNTVQKAVLEFLEQHIGNDLLLRLPVVTDAPGPGYYKAGLPIEVNVALDAAGPDP